MDITTEEVQDIQIEIKAIRTPAIYGPIIERLKPHQVVKVTTAGASLESVRTQLKHYARKLKRPIFCLKGKDGKSWYVRLQLPGEQWWEYPGKPTGGIRLKH